MSEVEEPGVAAAMDTSNIANDFEELLAAVQGDNDGFIKLIARHVSAAYYFVLFIVNRIFYY